METARDQRRPWVLSLVDLKRNSFVTGDMAMGQNPVPPVNIPIPTKTGPKMGGAPSPKWDPIGFEPWPHVSFFSRDPSQMEGFPGTSPQVREGGRVLGVVSGPRQKKKSKGELLEKVGYSAVQLPPEAKG